MTNHSFSFEAIGTHWQIDFTALLTPQEKKELLTRIHKRIDSFDQAYSRFRTDSLVTKVSQKKGSYKFPPDAPPLFTLYQKLYSATDGAFTPLIGNVISDAGYDANYSFETKPLTAPPDFSIVTIKDRELSVKDPVLLDIGAAGKGYLIDLIGDVMKENRIHAFCIDAGGDILHADPEGKTLRVGLEHPTETKTVIGIATIANQSICGSAGNRRKWGKYHHIINPKTLISPQHILATWVIADTAMVADAIATCLFFTPAETLQKAYDFEHLMMYADYTVEKSSDFSAELFT